MKKKRLLRKVFGMPGKWKYLGQLKILKFITINWGAWKQINIGSETNKHILISLIYSIDNIYGIYSYLSFMPYRLKFVWLRKRHSSKNKHLELNIKKIRTLHYALKKAKNDIEKKEIMRIYRGVI